MLTKCIIQKTLQREIPRKKREEKIKDCAVFTKYQSHRKWRGNVTQCENSQEEDLFDAFPFLTLYFFIDFCLCYKIKNNFEQNQSIEASTTISAV